MTIKSIIISVVLGVVVTFSLVGGMNSTMTLVSTHYNVQGK